MMRHPSVQWVARRFFFAAWAAASFFVVSGLAPVWADDRPPVRLTLFWSASCPHCLEARPQILALASELPWLDVQDYELSAAPEHRERFAAMAAQLGARPEAVPTLFYCGTMRVGFSTHELAPLREELETCYAEGSKRGPDAVFSDAQGGDLVTKGSHLITHLPMIGKIDASQWSVPMLTVLIASMDSFNPCAFFVLLFLLSLLVNQRDRRRILIIGLTFVGISGAMYFAFMAAWLSLFTLLGSLPLVTAVSGAVALVVGALNVKDFFAFKRGISLSISDRGRADIIARSRGLLSTDRLPTLLGTTALLAIAANFYELLCTAGFPMVFTRILTLQVEPGFPRYAYLALYNVVYVLPLVAIVLVFGLTLGAHKLSEREGRLLKLLSGVMMSGLGLLLVVAPERLNSVGASVWLVALSVALTTIAARLTRK